MTTDKQQEESSNHEKHILLMNDTNENIHRPFDEVDDVTLLLQNRNQQLSKTFVKLEARVQSLQKENDQNQGLVNDLQAELSSLLNDRDRTIKSNETQMQELKKGQMMKKNHCRRPGKRVKISSCFEQQQQQQPSSGKRPKRTVAYKHRKAFFQSWGQQLMRDSARHKITNGLGGDLYVIVVKEDSFQWTTEDFDSIFHGSGLCNDPKHLNSKKAQHRRRLVLTKSQIKSIFADDIPQDGYKVKALRKQSTFSVSRPAGVWDAFLETLEVDFDSVKGCLQLR
eukprot:CAMPEP_0194239438 /NCGR_PEP_ID=MMETSP0158-20130606/5895_1 /TAXON_ID=33649 /ORGANISM="Thalassionema nitzschioides, Strain L26-B" /LENGTH=281 /DNA_ID=CAMNT_0038973905 /DNA_START=75 /DNA_END=916 /DNA_ORIENTATION=+